MFVLVWSSKFTRSARKFLRKHPDLRDRFERILSELEADPDQPSLRLHPLRGTLDGYHAVSLTHAYRITLTIKLNEREIEMIDIGSHDEVY